MKKIVLLAFVLVLLSTAVVVRFVRPVVAQGTIYIRSYGSVDPPTAPIQRDGDVYTFIDNIYDSIVVERDNIMVDGAGYTIQGTGNGAGIFLSGRSNVTIRNMQIKAFNVGIYLYWSSNNILRSNRMTNNKFNFIIAGSTLSHFVNDVDSSNTVDGKPMYHWVNQHDKTVPTDAGHVALVSCTGITVQNLLLKNSQGILLASTGNSTITQNTITNNDCGVELHWSSSNTISGNSITATFVGIRLRSSSNYNTLLGNKIENNEIGIKIEKSSNNNTVSGNNVKENGSGITLGGSAYNNIIENSITNNGWGLDISNSQNIISRNNVTHNWVGIRSLQSSNNIIYHNNFVDNTMNQIVDDSTDVWDYGSSLGGNFWSDYTGVDANGDGIGDTPYILDANNRDRYPLMSICEAWKPTFISISTSSPSTLLGLAVNITGTLYDAYGNGLDNKTVVLYYTFSGANAWVPITSDNTDHLGRYSVKWIPPATGYFVIKAEWAGNTTHFTASNSITLSTIPYKDKYVFSVESNSTILGLAFNMTSQVLSFTADGPSGTRGYVKLTIAKSLVDNIASIRVYLDGNQTEYSITSMDGSWLLTFDYIHSTHQIVIELNPSRIPATKFLGLDWWLWVIILVVGALSAAAFIFRRRKPPTPNAPTPLTESI